jgi:hypothetical protein
MMTGKTYDREKKNLFFYRDRWPEIPYAGKAF